MKRRDFIANSLAASVLPVFFNGFSLSGLGSLGVAGSDDDKVLVVIQLSGGNDGLNTVIPLNHYRNYKNARPNIAIPEAKLLKIPQSDKIGLHPSLSSLAGMFKDGLAALVHDVGYPHPDFSHFRSSDIWSSASDADQYVSSGWVGRYLSGVHPDFPDHYPNDRYPDPLAIQIGAVNNLALQGPLHTMGMTISDPAFFYNLIENKTEEVPDTLAGRELSYLRRVSSQTNRYGEVVKAAAAKVTQQKEYPDTSLAAQLKIVARLIGGGLKTKVYYVNIGGFDTHAGQVDPADPVIGVHAVLLKQLSEAISAFYADLKGLGVSKRVTGMTYSEFGRRVRSNASNGTDHGAAAPMFLFGDAVNPVVLGQPLDIPATLPAAYNVPMQYDFRSVYAAVLGNLFCLPASDLRTVLFNSYQHLPLFKSGICEAISAGQGAELPGDFRNYPNPFTAQTTFEFSSAGGHCMIQVFDALAREVMVPLEGMFEQGVHARLTDMSRLPEGTYMARFQNGEYQKIIRIIRN